MSDETTMTGGQAIVRSLVAHGIDRFYCLPGVQSDNLFNAVFDSGGALKPIHTRHEQGAAYMALGAALATGKPAAYSVVPGPGFLNTGAALSTAWATNAKVVCLTGQIPTYGIGKGYGLLHEIPDQLAIVKQLTKWADRIETPGQAPAKIAEAFRQVNSGRPRPVGLELPQDMLGAREAVTAIAPLPLDESPVPTTGDLALAADLIAKAECPMIFVGGGALDASDEVRQLAELIGAPVVSDRNGRGTLDGRHPLSLTLAGAHDMWAACDLAIGIGARLQVALMNWGTDDKLKTVRIDIDAEEMDRIRKPDAALHGDAAQTTALLIDALRGKEFPAAARTERVAALKADIAGRLAFLEPQLSFLKVLRDVLPEDGILVDELTQVGYAARVAWEAYKPRTLLTPGFQGTLGWGYATALGAKDAVGARPVIAISGDGGFMYQVQELATAVRHQIPLVLVIFADGAFGNVQRIQREIYDNRVIASDLANPDFVRLGESFGITSVRARTPDELRAALDVALASGQPRLIEVPVGRLPSPWGFINMPKVR
jgi:acetolactate synthase-1/2/3 large subunit